MRIKRSTFNKCKNKRKSIKCQNWRCNAKQPACENVKYRWFLLIVFECQNVALWSVLHTSAQYSHPHRLHAHLVLSKNATPLDTKREVVQLNKATDKCGDFCIEKTKQNTKLNKSANACLWLSDFQMSCSGVWDYHRGPLALNQEPIWFHFLLKYQQEKKNV